MSGRAEEDRSDGVRSVLYEPSADREVTRDGVVAINLQSDSNIPVIRAFKALERGEADSGQQALVLSTLLFGICRIRDLSFRPSDERLTSFYEGRRFVGLEIAKLFGAKVKEKADG